MLSHDNVSLSSFLHKQTLSNNVPLPLSLSFTLLPLFSHTQLMWMCHRIMEQSTFRIGMEHIISYLPLSHIATQLLDIFTMLSCAGTCWFAQPDAFKGSLLHTMKEVRPTIFLGVPRSVSLSVCLVQ